jgi:septal ring factor EnvC (AmiA/AmiB activator)
MALCCLLPSILLFAVFVQSALGAGDPKPGTILVRELNMRSGPGRHNPPIATLRKGDKVLVLSYEGQWVRILYQDRTGFIMNREKYLRIEEPGAAEARPDIREATENPQEKLAAALARSREKVALFSKEEAAVIQDLDETGRALSRARKESKKLAAALKSVEQRIAELKAEYDAAENRVRANEAYVAERLAALYKLSWLGRFHLLASTDSMFDFFTNKKALEQILARDEAVLSELLRDKKQMQALLDKQTAQKKDRQATAMQLQTRIEAMNQEQARRETLLAEIRGKKSLQLAAIDALKQSANDLDRTVASFSDRPSSTLPPPPVVVEKPFAALKGLLMMPVKGRIVSFFGHYQDSRYKVPQFQSGVHIKADRGEPIRSVYSGTTLFSDWFKGFGNMIIIDHGDHYYTVYAHLEEQFKSKGDPVETGEVIATVGETGSLTGAGLHFEVRHHGKPMNPLGWIKKG